jgi:hypothetical protein
MTLPLLANIHAFQVAGSLLNLEFDYFIKPVGRRSGEVNRVTMAITPE